MKAATTFLAIVTLLAVAGQAEEPKTNGWAHVSITPAAQYITVSGDEDQFRADQWVHDQWTYGLASATLHKVFGKDVTLDFTGRAIANDGDYQVTLDITKQDVGYISAGFTQFRHYFDTSGGYYAPFAVPSFSLPGDWYLNVGKIYVDVGLTLPKLPKLHPMWSCN